MSASVARTFSVEASVIDGIPFAASADTRAALAAIGRTEDVRFSPDNRLLAIAGFGRNRCLILRIRIERHNQGIQVHLDDFIRLASPAIGLVHGLDFIDNETLALANRNGLVSIVKIPQGEFSGTDVNIEATREISGGWFGRIETPGSIAARASPNGKINLFVCNNYANSVTRHIIDPRRGYRLRGNRLLLQRGLIIPDGISLSHDGRWIAVSSHNTHDVKIYDASHRLGRKSHPAGVLQDANYPHGLRFTADDRHLLVADAGSQVVLVYDRGDDWNGVRKPARAITVMDDESFIRGRHNPQEGGPKGLDIDRSGAVVAITCEELPLAFVPLEVLLVDKPS